ncbi:MAG TPA: CAP domain-containing protein [Candidatus Dojkabacteria bacterium]|nr:CAP domain-containing protein [Candidatus Dojkabacteria bacterium]
MLKLLFIPHEKNKYQPYLLRKVALLFYTFLILISNFIPLYVPGLQQKAYASSITADKLIEYTNSERRNYDLNELKANAKLTSAAYAKANDMLANQYWDHFGPDGQTPWQFIDDAQYEYVFAGENLAKGFQTAEGLHQAWMASPTHRENIISGNYQDIGIAVVNGNLLGEDVILVVQMFGNITSEVVEAPMSVSGQKIQQIKESGEIKSIKISYPLDNQVINESRLRIEGSADGQAGTLVLENNQSPLGNVSIGDDGKWQYIGNRDWTEGNNTVKATSDNNKDIFDQVDFIVDTTPPEISDDAIVASVLGKNIEISVATAEQSPEILLSAGSKSYVMNINKTGMYSVTIPKNVKTATIIATDAYGNSIEKDITNILSSVAKAENTAEQNTLVNFIQDNLLTKYSFKDIVGFAIALLVMVLMIIEIKYYAKMGKLAQRSYSLLFVGVWWFLLVSGLIWGFTGNVI